MPWLRDMPLTRTNERSSISASTAQSNRRIRSALESHIRRAQSWGRVSGRFLPSWIQPSRIAMKVRSNARARLRPKSLAHELGDCVRPVRHRGHVDRDRAVSDMLILPHDMIRAGEDDPLDPRQGRRVKDVRQGVEVGTDQLCPGGKLVAVGREMDDRVDAVEMGNPVIVQDREVGLDDFGIVGRQRLCRSRPGRRHRPRPRGACGRCCRTLR